MESSARMRARPPPRPGLPGPLLNRSPGRDSTHRVDERVTVTGVTILQGDGALAVESSMPQQRLRCARWASPSLCRVAGCCSRISADPSRASATLTSPASTAAASPARPSALTAALAASGSRWSGEPGVSPLVPTTVIAPSPTPSAASATITVPSGLPAGGRSSTARGMSSNLARGAGSPPDQAPLTPGRCAALVTSGRDPELVMSRAVCNWIGWKR
jgi:hypothetical protein